MTTKKKCVELILPNWVEEKGKEEEKTRGKKAREKEKTKKRKKKPTARGLLIPVFSGGHPSKY